MLNKWIAWGYQKRFREQILPDMLYIRINLNVYPLLMSVHIFPQVLRNYSHEKYTTVKQIALKRYCHIRMILNS